MFRRVILALLFSAASAAPAAPTQAGAPRRATDVPGCAVSGHGSGFAVKAHVSGAQQDALGALTIHDGRTGAAAELAYGTFWLRFSDVEGARFSSRAIAYGLTGWTEVSTEGEQTATVTVTAIARDVFAVSVTLDGITSPITLQASLAGALTDATAAVTSGEGAFPVRVSITGAGDPLTVALGSTATSTLTTSSGGASYTATIEQVVSAPGTTGFLLAFGGGSAEAAARGTAALTAHADPAGWGAAGEAAFAAFASGFTVPRTGDATLLALDQQALSILWHNALADEDGEVLGVLPAKTALNHFETRDTGFIAAAAAERSAAWALQILDGVLRGQRPAGSPHAGLIPHRVDAEGGSPSLEVLAATDDYSERPAFSFALRALQSLATPSLASAERQRLVDALSASLAWWRAQRDWDEDLVLEGNGGLEVGAEGSPRFEEVWGTGPNAGYPVPFADPVVRTPLNAADVASSLYGEYVEASQLAGAAGDEALQRELLSRANLLALQIDEATFGHWDEGRGAYFDYWLEGPERDRVLGQVRTPVMWSPLVYGVARELPRVNRAIGHLISEAEFWRPHGVPSVAIGEPSFDDNVRWRGAAAAEQQYEAMVALYRYGYEVEAEAVRTRMLSALAVNGSFPEAYSTEDADAVGTQCFSTTASVAILAARHRHQADPFALTRGAIPTARTGALRRLFRLNDGQLLLTVSVPGSREVPVTAVASDTQIFGYEPMVIELSDPNGVVGDAIVQLELPTLDSAQARWVGGPNEGRSERLRGPGLALDARVGDRIEISEPRYIGEQTCRCGAGGIPLLPVAAFLIAGIRRRRRG